MDSSGIKEIARMATSTEENESLRDMDAVVLPDGYKLQSLENFKDAPVRFKGKFSTSVLSEFVKYVNLNADSEGSGIFISPERMTATAILDLGTDDNPCWATHKAEVVLSTLPALKALYQNESLEYSTRDFIDFVEDWREHITFFVDSDTEAVVLPFAHHLRNLRNVKVLEKKNTEHQLNNHSTSNSVLEKIEITAGNDDLPSCFNFKLTPYEDFETITFFCQLRAITDDKGVKFKYRSVN